LGLDLCLEEDPPVTARASFVAVALAFKDAYASIKALPITFVPGPLVTGFGTLSPFLLGCFFFLFVFFS
jgi:hypothetical protein